jgi:hypothetical protein
LYLEKRLDGCLVVSLDFQITGLEPTEIISLSDGGIQKQLCIYDFR